MDQLANPFRKDSGGVKPPSTAIAPKEMARLYVMALVFLMAVGGMIYARKWMTPTGAKKGKLPAGQVDYRIQEGGGAAPASGGQEAQPREKKDVPVAPLPKDGIVNYRELAAPFRDGEEKPVKETPEFVNLLNVFMNAVTPESLSKAVNPALTVDQAFLDPNRHRGEVVRAYGRLIKIYTEPMDCTTPDNVKHVYLGVLQEYPKNRTVMFYLPELPKDAGGKPVAFKTYKKGGEEFYEDWVEVEGVFLRQYLYASQFEDDQGRSILAKAALLFAKNLRITPRPQMTDTRTGFIWGVGILAVVVIVIVIVAGVMSRKYGSGSLRGRMRELRKRKPEFPKPSGEKQVLGDEIPKPAASTAAGAEPPGPPAAAP
jgi:hypothetical protein